MTVGKVESKEGKRPTVNKKQRKWIVYNSNDEAIGNVYGNTVKDAENAVLNCRIGINIFGDEPAYIVSGKEKITV